MAIVRVYHNPNPSPSVEKPNPVCQRCGRFAKHHRVDHIPKGDGERCSHCVSRQDKPDHNCKAGGCRPCNLHVEAHYKKHQALKREKRYYIGIDGEGQGRGHHRYVMIAWSDESGKHKGSLEAPEGGELSTEQCLDFILSTPYASRAFAYAFNYDLTKLLKDLDEEALWLLFRSDQRQRRKGYEKHGPKPVHWRKYLLNIEGAKFTVEHKETGARRVIWDVFKFYQAKFTSALEDWYKTDPEWATVKPQIDRMRLMKDKRHLFDQETREAVRTYCLEECQFMAGLTRKLIDAHEKAELHLKNFHGAGSTAGAVLKSMAIHVTSKGKDYSGPLLSPEEWRACRNGPEAMREAIAMAFFGGRFEHSRIGAIRGLPLTAEVIARYSLKGKVGEPGPIFGHDISSAYPYQLWFLPCLECGTWSRTTDRKAIERSRHALVRYSLNPSRCPKDITWGPFPFREKGGSIVFPAVSGGGWVWRDEYLAGERHFPHVDFHEAWIYECECDHKPFNEIPRLYRERLRIGKEGPGIVIKLGCNACYGKLAQSIGTNPPFQSWIWSGMVTSGTRAQLLDLLGLHKDRSNALAMATDGLYTLEDILGAVPVDTDTAGLYGNKDQKEPKPLGGWEKKLVDRGMFFARPGIYFPLNPTEEDLKAIRARGVGRAAMHANWERCISAYEAGSQLHLGECSPGWSLPGPMLPGMGCECPRGVRIAHVDRFHGAKSSISRSEKSEKELAALMESGEFGRNPLTGKPRGKPCEYNYNRDSLYGDDDKEVIDPLTRKPVPRYGEWTRRHVDMNFNPMPKREPRINPDGTLDIRRFPLVTPEGAPYLSTPYKKSIWSEDKARLWSFMEELLEQPDGGDFADYERGLDA